MTTVLQNPNGRRRDVMHRQDGAALSDTAPLRSEERFQMLIKSVFVDHDLSILGMLRLNDADNILISTTESLWKCRDMLLARMAKSDPHDVQFHLRPNLLNIDVAQAVGIAQQGAQVVLWQADPVAPIANADRLTVVHSRRTNISKAQGFMVIRTPTSSRILAAWTESKDKVVGVLVTNPRTVDKVWMQLNTIAQSGVR